MIPDDNTLTTEEAEVWTLLRNRPRIFAKNSWWLAGMTEINQRALRKIVQALRRKGKAIGSSSQKPAGYWHLVDPEEKERVAAQLRRQGLRTLETAAAIKNSTPEEELAVAQMELL
ncbi:hypothetical protein LCGC14_0485940 [marine sediment metagenome]|uniref:Helix-turn-helix type 11 domain-containing protein n=1 Tax=marine sediment metagenome TaxID=412755 RepID=A0A0F9SRA7_9ZZZZ